MNDQPVYYGDYLQLESLLNSQHRESEAPGKQPAHDEMLFIIIHQAYELWFKQILFEVDSVAAVLNKPAVNDNSPELQTIVHRLQRVVTILKVLVHQVDILETMTPMDFLDFRDMLRPASGFQSWQFKVLEARLGLKFEQRHGQEYYVSQLKEEQIRIIKEAEMQKPLTELLNNWLERMPFFEKAELWSKYENLTGKSFWDDYEKIYTDSLDMAEKENALFFRKVMFEAGPDRFLSPKASRSALFIMLYRGYPMLELPFQLMDTLLQIDNEMGNWRYRHINMVRRMIGTRIGTGGSTGAGYLKGAMDRHLIFRELAQLSSFLIDRRKLPSLPEEWVMKMGYNN